MSHKAAGGIKSRVVVSKPVKTGVGARAVNKNWPAQVGLSRGNRVQGSESGGGGKVLKNVRADPYKGPSFHPSTLGNKLSVPAKPGGGRTVYKSGFQAQHGAAVPGVSRPSTKGQWPD